MTSSETFFPNKDTLAGSRGLMELYLWGGHHSTHSSPQHKRHKFQQSAHQPGDISSSLPPPATLNYKWQPPLSAPVSREEQAGGDSKPSRRTSLDGRDGRAVGGARGTQQPTEGQSE